MARAKLPRLLLGILTLALVAGACSSGTGSNGAQGKSSFRPKDNVVDGPAGIAPLVDVTASPTFNPHSAPKSVPAPKAPKGAVKCPERVIGGPKETPPEDRSYVYATVNRDLAWDRNGQGKDCAHMAPGDDCWVPFYGSWQLHESFQGSMVFQAFENGASTPVRSPEVGPVPSAGSFNRTTRFNYKPSAGAKNVTFRVLLKDQVGRVVAMSKPETLPIPLCAEFFTSYTSQ
jgi:hypothetical protein